MNKVMLQLNNETARKAAHRYLDLAQEGDVFIIKEPTRNLDINARLWASLAEISEQVEWYGKKLTPEDWKHVFTSSLRKLEVVPNLEGNGFVALGLSTSRMSQREVSMLLSLIYSFGDERGVKFKEPNA